MNISSTNSTVLPGSSITSLFVGSKEALIQSAEKVKATVQACYAAPLGKIILSFTALGVASYSASQALKAEEATATVGYLALGTLGSLVAAFVARDFARAHGDDVRELTNVLLR